MADPFMDFMWRLRVDVRSAVDLPSYKGKLPSTFIGDFFLDKYIKNFFYFIGLGWSLYDNQSPDPYSLQRTKTIENTKRPSWNQQFLISNPSTVLNKGKFQNY